LTAIEERPRDVFDCLKGKVEILGDLLAPIVPPEDWESSR